jgi:SAM-dependent methyltransferase
MAKTDPFDAHPNRYDDWFERHKAAYQSELHALWVALSEEGEGLEVGVGTGRFAAPLCIEHGVDPSPEMRKRARKRGIDVKDGVAEDLPVPGCAIRPCSHDDHPLLSRRSRSGVH